jgi:hypothetical protein
VEVGILSQSVIWDEFLYFNKSKKYIKPSDIKKIESLQKDLSDKEYIVYQIKNKNNQGTLLIDSEKMYILKTDMLLQQESFSTIFSYVKLSGWSGDSFSGFFTKKLSEQEELIFETLRDTEISKKIFSNLDDFITYKLEFLYESGGKKVCTLHDSNDVELLKNDVWFKELFLDDIPYKQLLEEETPTINYGDVLFCILNVVEKRINNQNYRIALLAQNSELYIWSVSEEDYEFYTVIEKDRMLYKSWRVSSTIVFDAHLLSPIERTNYRGEAYITYMINSTTANNLSNFTANSDNTYIYLSPQMFSFYNSGTTASKDYKVDLIVKKYKEKLSEGKEVKINGCLVSPKKITINEYLNIDIGNNFCDVAEHIHTIRGLINDIDTAGNINELYDKFIKDCTNLKFIKKYSSSERGNGWNGKSDNFKEYEELQESYIDFTINGIYIKIEQKGTKWYVNESFVRLDDIMEIVATAICYRSQNDFDSYVKNVSAIGLKWKSLISNGLHISIRNPINRLDGLFGSDHPDITLRVSFVWDQDKRSIVYVLMNDKKYKITKKSSFLSKFYVHKKTFGNIHEFKTEFIGLLEDAENIDVFTLVDNGLKEFAIVLQRGQQLVEDTVKMTKSQEQELTIQNRTYKGYYLRGRVSNGEYFIVSGDLSVFKKMNGSWNRRCVVDDSGKTRIYEDRLANRLVNIYNEPKRIYTIQ